MNTKRTERSKHSLTLKVAATALALSASMAGANAVADHQGYQQKQDSYRNAPIRSSHRDVVRVKIPVRDHGPENLALGRLIRTHSNVDLDRYRLKAVITNNGRFSNGYATLRTGNRKTGRYFLGSRAQTRILAPSRADNTWRLRLGPGTQVKSITAVLEPRAHSLAHRGGYKHDSWSQTRTHRGDRQYPVSANRSHASWMSVAWLIAKSDEDKAEKEKRAKQLNKRLKKTRAELARTEAELNRTQEKLARVKASNKQPKSQPKSQPQKQAPRKAAGERKSRNRDTEQNRRYVISGGKSSNRDKHS